MIGEDGLKVGIFDLGPSGEFERFLTSGELVKDELRMLKSFLMSRDLFDYLLWRPTAPSPLELLMKRIPLALLCLRFGSVRSNLISF